MTIFENETPEQRTARHDRFFEALADGADLVIAPDVWKQLTKSHTLLNVVGAAAGATRVIINLWLEPGMMIAVPHGKYLRRQHKLDFKPVVDISPFARLL